MEAGGISPQLIVANTHSISTIQYCLNESLTRKFCGFKNIPILE